MALVTRGEELAELSRRVTRAVAERDAWRAAGRQEKYLEAYSKVSALELQLDALRRSSSAAASGRKH